MNNKVHLIIAAILIAFGCSNEHRQSLMSNYDSCGPHANEHRQVLILNYDDFGPQAMAWKTIGMQWWQWDHHGDSDPNTKYDIKVVVYRNIPLEAVKERFPVVKEQKKDYRYLAYDKALEYLDKNIKEHKNRNEKWAMDTVTQLTRVRTKIVQELREKD